ncbi:NAD(P)H-dependent glycerol-3-phosphate dehydrogenase [Acidisoma sp.]|uniref:NAD(P)H-dependent glycerol-3-phosphate dehydrogenase n=1 Tax=Acidisoma sp. TaxID=1872115 RepID=UPI003B0087F3
MPTDPWHVLIVGYGGFGQALALSLHRSDNIAIDVFTRRPAAADQRLNAVSRFIHHLPEIDLARYDIAILALPSGALASVLDRIPRNAPRATVLSCVKGMDAETHAFPTDLIALHLPGHPIGMLSGPTFAGEMMAGHKVWMSLGCRDPAQGQALAARLAGPRLALTATTDVRGLEIVGVAKNIVAIGAGLVQGLGLGENTRASYVARGIGELQRLLPSLGGRAETVMAPGALGDLILTCTSRQSRNYRFGQELGERIAPLSSEGVSALVPLAEGSRSITSFLAFMRRQGATSPFFEGLATAIGNPSTMSAKLLATID